MRNSFGHEEAHYSTRSIRKSGQNFVGATLPTRWGVRWLDVQYSVPQRGTTRYLDPFHTLSFTFPNNLQLGNVRAGVSVKGGPPLERHDWPTILPENTSSVQYKVQGGAKYWFDRVTFNVSWRITIGNAPVIPDIDLLFGGGMSYDIRIPEED